MGGGGAPRMAARAGGGRGGGRRSDVALKHDITVLGHLENGLGFYRFSYNGSKQVYVGVIAQEVQTIMPEAVVRDRDGYLEVLYDKLGLKFQTYDQWLASGARVPSMFRIGH
jgi:Chaperone of endosialidase